MLYAYDRSVALSCMSLQWCMSVLHVCVSNLPQEESPEIIKPVPISHPPAPAPSASPTNPPPSSAYNKTARPFGASNFRAVSPSSTPTAHKASIPSASSAFTPAAPSQQPPPQPAQGPQPPFPLASSSTSRTLNPTHKPGSAYSPFSHSSSSSSSSGSSSPARVTGPAPSSAPVVPQPSVYNTPFNLYSNENACEVAMGQRRGLLEQQGAVEHQNG